MLAVGNDEQWVRFCRVAGLAALEADARFATNAGRVHDYHALEPSIRQALAADTRVGWTARLVAATAVGRSHGRRDAGRYPTGRSWHDRAPGKRNAGEIAVLGVPVKLSATPGGVREAPPMLGEDTDAVLKEFGLTDAEIERLRRSRVV